MANFDAETLAAAGQIREIGFTTAGRQSGEPRQVTMWISTDGRRLFIRSGAGLERNWVRNLLASGRGVLHLGGRDIPVQARHVTDPSEARAVSGYVAAKYGSNFGPSAPDAPLQPGEQATFELLPDA
jgi:deazaflavin-dependent oxidoreductase (nitroreductase family)